MCGLRDFLQHHCRSSADHRVLDDEGLRQRWSAAAHGGRERFSRVRFIAEQTRIYENLFRPARTGALTAVAAC